ncbi:MAG: DUF4349 domain-containing protein [Actinobacteria bacterium]|nr:DUF4349 domain-containing protein [Actinomycetota bacterium]
MPARLRMIVRSYPGRTAAVAVAVLLASGAVVAALGGGGGNSDDATTSLSSSALTSGGARDGAAPSGGYGSSPNEPASAAPESSPGAPVPSGGATPAAQASAGMAASRSAGGAAANPPAEAPVSPGVGPAGLGGQPLPAAVAAGTARIVKNANLSVSVKRGGLGDGYQRAIDAAAAVGGWVQASQTGTDQATITLKVPSDKLAGVMGTIRGLGKVTSVSETGEDVTGEYVDLEARIGHWRAQEAVFVGLMAKAKTIPETIQIQQQLSTIQEQIEQLEGRRRLLDGQTSFSTLRLTLLEEGAVPKPDDTGPKPQSTLSRSWERAGSAALAVLGGTIVVLGVLGPLAVVVGIPAWVLALVLRRRDGRRRDTAPAQG